MVYEMDTYIGISHENGFFENKEYWLENFYEKNFITEEMHHFFLANLEYVTIAGGFEGFSKMMISGMEVTMYHAEVRYKGSIVIELNEEGTLLGFNTTVIWDDKFIKTNNLVK